MGSFRVCHISITQICAVIGLSSSYLRRHYCLDCQSVVLGVRLRFNATGGRDSEHHVEISLLTSFLKLLCGRPERFLEFGSSWLWNDI